MNTENKIEIDDTSWNHEDVVVDFDAVIDAIEKDIAKTKSELIRLAGTEDNDVLFI